MRRRVGVVAHKRCVPEHRQFLFLLGSALYRLPDRQVSQ